MENVESVSQIDDTHLRWIAEYGGERNEWTAEITEQVPDQRIAWQGQGGVQQSGIVTFEPLDEAGRRSASRWSGSPRASRRRPARWSAPTPAASSEDLDRFKEMIETRGVETGAWRGSV